MSLDPDLTFSECFVDDLVIDDEAAFRHVGLYADLKQILRGAAYRFRILPPELEGRWDRALLLNLTFWGANEGGDLLVDRHLSADVVTHAAWHHLANRALTGDTETPPTPGALFLGEAIASAFDLYLVGRLLGRAPDSSFLEGQVPAMAEAAEAAGLPEDEFEELLHGIALDPELAFADLRELLSDATAALHASNSAEEALTALSRFDGHRFAPLLHHYELSNWVLYARAYARPAADIDARVEAVDRALRQAPVALEWLTTEWVAAALESSAAREIGSSTSGQDPSKAT
jgi:hypothetical protein